MKRYFENTFENNNKILSQAQEVFNHFVLSLQYFEQSKNYLSQFQNHFDQKIIYIAEKSIYFLFQFLFNNLQQLGEWKSYSK